MKRYFGSKNRMKLTAIIICFTLMMTTTHLNILAASKKVGDPHVTFGPNDSRYNTLMNKWKSAGVDPGIPFESSIRNNVKVTLTGGNSRAINNAITEAKGKGGHVLLKNGNYNIDAAIKMKTGVSIVGESRDGVICTINKSMTRGGAFEFLEGVHNSGIYDITIKGGWFIMNNGKKQFYPKHKWNIGSKTENNELDGNSTRSVSMVKCYNCWLDNVKILNSADHPLWINANHNTIRDVNIKGAFNKHGGCHGYFMVMGAYNLITGCNATQIRHISIQGQGAEYNVFYKNDFKQEISFHTHDKGNNLVEKNTITLPADMPAGNGVPNYYAIMGPWSINHQLSTNKSFVYKNTVKELNHGGATPWSDNSVVYKGPHYVKPANPLTNFKPIAENLSPQGGSFYPVRLN
ncbi:hypothetical protein HZI73_06185 [Vallitalea pronyensis]|uniref:Pectate lyase n=1 Tax=Vallitalea pronyensis TaxID=1348613 RepID=A0A8J8MI72_9FIRM|nr:hypothetical protein [Vallitalea pronyensis]QUI21916.1 hypothetical protein HZI73_06185 [Vallitalea pronyensis]